MARVGWWMLLALASACALCSIAVAAEEAVRPNGAYAFVETFTEGNWEKRWMSSAQRKYNGKMILKEDEATQDATLYVPQEARAYGITALLKEPFDPKDKTTVLQYEVRFQDGIDCGGAYVKFLRENDNFDPYQMNDQTPYVIMFGPDKCGSTNKVHLILQHKNPKTGEFEEKHLKNPPTPITDSLSHVYTAVIRPDNTYEVLVDGESRSSGSLLTDFDPPVNPPKMMDDPEDKKPEDWVDTAKIPDPNAKKPDDWDESAPLMIPDESATKPAGWLDDEPELIDDPEAEMPEGWDEEEDGAWEPPKVRNPRCDEAPGCGAWTRPMTKNPKYKGKWTAPLIDNPEYKGEWKPRQILNPNYFEDPHPHNFEPIVAAAIEIWTMNKGITFDNFLITHDEEVAKDFRAKTWQEKFGAQKAAAATKKDEDDEEAEDFPTRVIDSLRAYLDDVKGAALRPYLTPLVQQLEQNKMLVYPLLASPLAFIFLLTACCLKGKQKPSADTIVTVEEAKKADITQPDDAPEEAEAEEGDDTKEEEEEDVRQPVDEAEGEIAEASTSATGQPRTTRRRKAQRDT
eukprot:jgi/Chlat1/4010/Chrsp26S04079